MKAFLDTNVFDWFVDDPRGQSLLVRFQNSSLQGLVFPEVSKEIRDVPESKVHRREALLSVLRPFFPVHPTLVPLAGLARSGTARSAPSSARILRAEFVELGFHKLDVIHLMNAHYSRCHVFLTNDRKDFLRRRGALQARFGLEVLRPSELLDRIETALMES